MRCYLLLSCSMCCCESTVLKFSEVASDHTLVCRPPPLLGTPGARLSTAQAPLRGLSCLSRHWLHCRTVGQTDSDVHTFGIGKSLVLALGNKACCCWSANSFQLRITLIFAVDALEPIMGQGGKSKFFKFLPKRNMKNTIVAASMGGLWPPDRAVWVWAIVLCCVLVQDSSLSLLLSWPKCTCKLNADVALRWTGEAWEAVNPIQWSLGADWLI